jgi:succinate dehydrogenase/fumarate reductase flavoprotein subunit
MVGPFRTGESLRAAAQAIERWKAEVGELPVSSAEKFDPVLIDWLDRRNMLLVAQSVTLSALARTDEPRRPSAGRLIRRWTTTGR